jgi:hypothetical protein
MTKQQKALMRLCASPPPADFKWAELRSVLEHLGYAMASGGGSRRKFYNAERNDLIICHQPHPCPTVDKGCVTDVVEHLRNKGFI